MGRAEAGWLPHKLDVAIEAPAALSIPSSLKVMPHEFAGPLRGSRLWRDPSASGARGSMHAMPTHILAAE